MEDGFRSGALPADFFARETASNTGDDSPRASRPDTAAATELDQLYREHAPVLSAKLRQTFGDGPPDPDDLTQQAFQKLIERGDTSDISSLKGFLWCTARNLLFNDKRDRGTRSKFDFEIEHLFFPNRGAESTPESVVGAREELRAINNAFGKMPEKRRLAFILHRIDGLSIAEVARRLHIARSPARRHILRAMEDIQVALADLRSGDKS
ncbi:MAG: sigma-70 family RNA polymerase sigma factor [Pseudomonadota bacterium]